MTCVYQVAAHLEEHMIAVNAGSGAYIQRANTIHQHRGTAD